MDEFYSDPAGQGYSLLYNLCIGHFENWGPP